MNNAFITLFINLVNVNENTVDHCLVMLVHSALTNVKQPYYFINALVNAVEYCSFFVHVY